MMTTRTVGAGAEAGHHQGAEVGHHQGAEVGHHQGAEAEDLKV